MQFLDSLDGYPGFDNTDDYPMEALRVRTAQSGPWSNNPQRFTRGDYAVKALLGAHLYAYWKLDQPNNSVTRQPWGTRPLSEYGGPGITGGGFRANVRGGGGGGGQRGGGYGGQPTYGGQPAYGQGASVDISGNGGGGCCAIV